MIPKTTTGRDVPRRVLGGFACGILPGDLFGSIFPWWISGSPCYCLVGVLWVCGVRGPTLTGVLCGTLGAAAATAMGAQTAPWIALAGTTCLLKSSWSGSPGRVAFGVGLGLYLATVISAAL